MNIIETLHSWVNKEAGIEISTKTRDQHYVFVRAVFYSLLRNNTSYSLSEIGKHVGVNHATVLHGVKNIYGDMKLNPLQYERYVKLYNKLEERLLDLEVIEPETVDHAYRTKVSILEQENQILEAKLKRILKTVEQQKPKYYNELLKEIS